MPSKLTKRIVDALPPGAVAWDSEIRGFGCRRSKGGAASYVLKYRAGGRQRWLTIGRHGAPWTPDAARKTALEALAEVARGGDPATAKREAKLTEAIAEFAERYTAEYARLHKKPTSLDADRYHLKNHILPKLGRIDLTDLSRRDVAKFHSSLHDRPYTANRCLALLSHMCAVAERWGARPDGSNPCRHVKKFKEKKRERFLSPEELGRLGEALVAEDARGGSLYTVAAIRLLTLTGARLNEILRLRWDDVDLEGRALRLRDSKTGAKTIHLAPPAIEVLSNLPRQDGNAHVICGRKTGTHMVNLQKPWRRIRKAAGLDDVRLHDLRHSFASVAVAGGASLPIIGALLGHTQPSTTARYAHLSDDPLRAANTIVSQRIAQAMAKPAN